MTDTAAVADRHRRLPDAFGATAAAVPADRSGSCRLLAYLGRRAW